MENENGAGTEGRREEEQKKQRDEQAFGSYYGSREREEKLERTRQKSLYNDRNRARADNNQFWEERSNPLSSKGN